MALMLAKLYTALREAGVDDVKAREAAEEVASFENRLANVEASLTILKWMVGAPLHPPPRPRDRGGVPGGRLGIRGAASGCCRQPATPLTARLPTLDELRRALWYYDCGGNSRSIRTRTTSA